MGPRYAARSGEPACGLAAVGGGFQWGGLDAAVDEAPQRSASATVEPHDDLPPGGYARVYLIMRTNGGWSAVADPRHDAGESVRSALNCVVAGSPPTPVPRPPTAFNVFPRHAKGSQGRGHDGTVRSGVLPVRGRRLPEGRGAPPARGCGARRCATRLQPRDAARHRARCGHARLAARHAADDGRPARGGGARRG